MTVMFTLNHGQSIVVSHSMRLDEAEADASYSIGVYRDDKLVSEHHVDKGKILPVIDCQAGDIIYVLAREAGDGMMWLTFESLGRAAAEVCTSGVGDHTGWWRSCKVVRCKVNRALLKRGKESYASGTH